jgi:EmrB/QacA subfamily drug resistance transporter
MMTASIPLGRAASLGSRDRRLMDQVQSAPAGVAGGRAGRAWRRDRREVRGSPALTLVAVSIGMMMVGIDGTIVAVANPSIQAELHASLPGIQWVTNGYLLALAVLLIPAGKAGDRFGHKKIFLAGIAGFAAASAGVGLSGDIAQNIGGVIAFRVVQGAFGAMLQPTALALLRRNFPPERLNSALGTWGSVIGASTACGPIVGGLLVQHVNWEACFYVNIPVALVAFAVSVLALRETSTSLAGRSFDLPGVGLLSLFLFALVWTLIKGSDYGWASSRTVVCVTVAAVALGLFIVRESKAAEPLLPLRLFRSVPLSAGVVLAMALMFGMFGAMFFMTFFFENVHGLGAVATGVRLLPLTAMMIVASPLAGRLVNRTGPRPPLIAGMLVSAVAMFGLSRIGLVSSLNDTIAWFALLGLGLSLVVVAATDVIVGNAPEELAGVASGVQATSMQVGGTIGTAALGAVMAGQVSALLPVGWSAAHLPPSGLAAAEGTTPVGLSPTLPGAPPAVADAAAAVSHATFMSGMSAGLLTAAIVALGGAVVAVLARGKPGERQPGSVAHF